MFVANLCWWHVAAGGRWRIMAPTKDSYSCRQYHAAQQHCAAANCEADAQERLNRECLRDGGRP